MAVQSNGDRVFHARLVRSIFRQAGFEPSIRLGRVFVPHLCNRKVYTLEVERILGDDLSEEWEALVEVWQADNGVWIEVL